MTGIRGLLIDLSGVVYQGSDAIEGSPEAIARLDRDGVPYRFLTNTTSRPLARILEKLAGLGIEADRDRVFTPAVAARAWLAERGLEPHFLTAPALKEDFAALPGGDATAVVVGDAGEGFTYARLNDAFRLLQGGAELVALAKNRMFIDSDGAPAMDVGAFVVALEFASGREAVVLGKPAPAFFHMAAADMDLSPEEVAMIGDDAEFDVAAAIEAGLAGILVRTGKAAGGGADGLEPAPTAVCDDLADAVDWVLKSKEAHA